RPGGQGGEGGGARRHRVRRRRRRLEVPLDRRLRGHGRRGRGPARGAARGLRLVTAVALLVLGGLLRGPAAGAAPDQEPLEDRRPPRVIGEQRFGQVVRAAAGRWARKPVRVHYQWLRAGKPIKGATSRRYRIAPKDVGRSLRVRVTA